MAYYFLDTASFLASLVEIVKKSDYAQIGEVCLWQGEKNVCIAIVMILSILFSTNNQAYANNTENENVVIKHLFVIHLYLLNLPAFL